MAINPQNSSQDPERLSVAEAAETSPAPKLDVKDRLELIKTEVIQGKNEDEREAILLSSLQNFLHPDEQTVLSQLETMDEPTESLKDYLFVGAALLSATYQAKTDKSNVSIRGLIDYFSSDPSQSAQTYCKALLFILNNPSTKVATWFTQEAWAEVGSEAQRLVLASSAVGEELGEEPNKSDKPKRKDEEGFVQDVKDTASKYSDEIKLAAIVGAIGFGMYAISKWFKGKFGNDSAEASTADNVLKYGAYALGGAFIYGKVVGSDWIQERFSKDNESFVHSRWSKAAIAFSSGEFGNALRFLFEGAPTEEQEKQQESLARLFEVDVDRLGSIAKLNIVDFMEGKSSTLLNLETQREADEKVRSRIQNYYYDQIKLIPNYETMTMGQIFEIGLRQGIFTSVDASDLTPDDQTDIASQKVDDEARLAALVAAFDEPEENMDELKEAGTDLLVDLKELTEFSKSWWGDAATYLDHALGFNLFTDAEDAHEYGDIKGIREYILATTHNGLEKDKKVFAEMAKQVQGFQGFLDEHPDPSEWTEADRAQFDLYKGKMIAMRQQLDNARREVNEQRQRDLLEDYGELTIDDLQEGVVLTLHGLTGVGEIIALEAQQVYEGDVLAWSLLITQVGGAGYQMMKDRPASGWGVVKSSLTGFVKGPYQAFSLGRDFMRAKAAYSYSSGELLKRYFRGEMSKADLEQHLEWAKKYSYLFERGPVGLVRSTRIGKKMTHSLTEKLRDLSRLEDHLAHFRAWDDHFTAGTTLAEGSDELSALRSHLNEAEITEIRNTGGAAGSAARRAASASQRVALDQLADGRVLIKVDGQVVNIAKNEEEAFKMADRLIEEAEKGGKHLDKLKLRNVWKFAGPLMQIVGTAFTVDLFYRIQTADSKEELQKVVAEETANIISFFVGSKLTLEVLLKIKKPTDPKLAALYAVLSLMGGFAAALELDEPIIYMVESFIEKQPNGYEVAQAAATALESGSLIATAKLNAVVIKKVGEQILKTQGGKAVQRVSKEALESLGKQMTRLAEKQFVKKLATACGIDALKMLLKKAGWKGAVGAGLFVIDGPVPIGDALGALFLAWTAKDVYDLSVLIYEGYKLHEELNKRLPLPVAKFEVKEPASLIEKYSQVDQSNASAAFEAILKEPNAVVRIQREGDAGYEVWTVENGEIANLTLYDMMNERIAGLNDEDLQRVAEAQELIEASEPAQESA